MSEHLLATVVDQLTVANWQRANTGKKHPDPPPKPLPRPVDKPKDIPVIRPTELRAFLSS